MLGCGAYGVAPLVQAQALEEVIVTAQKRDQSMQDVPIAVSVLGAQDLQNLGITDMEDYIQLFPNVNYVSLGPGSGNIYIRGISSGGESVLGSTPNVAVYLDEQPVTAVGQYLNPHVYDVAQIETLAGPQGTLFGANAQSGAIRMITNKPDPSEFSAGIDLEGNSVEDGDTGYLAEGFLNIPITESAALRLVGYYKKDAGYIDNVYGEHTFNNANVRAGLTDPDLIAIADDITINNAQFAEDDFNEATTIGGRATLRVDLGENWTVTAGIMRQELESDGVWDHDPKEVGDLEVTRFQTDSADDDWTQLSLVVEGQIGGMTLTYAGSDLDRELEQDADYSMYTDYYISGGFVQRYYSCYVAYFGDCVDPRILFENHSDYERTNHELRLASAPENRFRWLVGVFYEEGTHEFDLEWHVLGLADISPNFDENGHTLYPSAAIDEPDIYWTTDQKRENEETAYFGQIQFDITEQLTASVSARYFEYDSRLKGFSGTIWWPNCCWQRPPFNTDLETDDEDTVYRANLSYNINDDVMVYATYAEGYRPGGLNRVFDTVIGGTYEPDFVDSYEVGIKSTLMDGRLRFNAAAYMQEWDDFQLSRFDIEVSPLTLTDNVGTAESNGVEADFAFLVTDDWQVTGAISYIDATITEDYWVDKSQEGITEPDAEDGRELPRVPEWKWNLGTRYNFEVAGMDSYFQANYIYTGESYNQLFSGSNEVRTRTQQDEYDIVNLSVGVDSGSWGAELFVRNATDERGEVFINGVNWDNRVTTNRPRTFGVRTRFRF
jgi:outer membrane receptor protein involved in Fe transport